MRVLQLIDSLAPGGAEQSLVALAPELRQRGIDIEVAYLGREATLAPRLEAAGVPVHALADDEGRRGRFGSVLRTRRWLRARRPDLLHTTLFESDQAGRVAATIARVPVVSSLVNVSYGEEHLADPGVRRSRLRGAQALDALTARRVVRFHAITDVVADTMAPRLHVPRNRIDVIHRGRSAEALGERSPERDAEIRGQLGVPVGAPLVVAAARHEYQKGLDVLLRSLPQVVTHVPDLVVVIAGRTGNATHELEGLRDELDLGQAVQMLGRRDDVPDLLAAADAFVLPSRWEGLGSVLIEAMALEAPIVASDLPAVREVLGRDLAVLVPAERPQELAAAIVATLQDRAASARRAAAARRTFLESYEIASIAVATIAFYRRALGE
jgi:glycosyltransferase involved in cell wall biosynthesis